MEKEGPPMAWAIAHYHTHDRARRMEWMRRERKKKWILRVWTATKEECDGEQRQTMLKWKRNTQCPNAGSRREQQERKRESIPVDAKEARFTHTPLHPCLPCAHTRGARDKQTWCRSTTGSGNDNVLVANLPLFSQADEHREKHTALENYLEKLLLAVVVSFTIHTIIWRFLVLVGRPREWLD